jgi:acyl-CoA thioester hydrolase
MTEAPAPTRTTTYRHPVRYFEVDQQGVVFNMWYLGYFDEAMTAHLDEGGLAYPDMLAGGYDVQLVHTEIDWKAPLRWRQDAVVEVSLRRMGTTSFELAFAVTAGDVEVAAGRTTYVVVATDGSGKLPIPERLRSALTGGE